MPGEKTKKSKNSVPTLESLWHNLEMANSHPNNALDYLKELYKDADQIVQMQRGTKFSLLEK